MNAIQTKARIDFYNNLTTVDRFRFSEYNIAVNDAIQEFINENLGDTSQRDPQNFQWIQRIRDNLYTLITTSTPTVTPGTAITNQYYTHLPSTFPFPADYSDFIMLQCLIDGYTVYARPTTFNLLGPLLEDSFRHPTNLKPYYNDTASGMTIWRENAGTFTSATFTYLKQPTAFSIGQESQLVTAPSSLTVATYYATEVTVFSGVTYQIGDSITGTATPLTSGQAILASNTTAIVLPVTAHEEIAKRASAKMLATIAELQQSAAITNEANRGE